MPTNWKRKQATSLSHAMELCINHGLEVHNRSVDNIADLIGLANKFTLYKYMASGKLPTNLILPFENACGASFITDYLACASNKVIIPIPRGKKAKQDDLLELQTDFNEAINVLSAFYKGNQKADETIAKLTKFIGAAAWHRENVAKSATPEFDFDGGEQ